MPTDPVSKTVVCPDCGATISAQAIVCWLCARRQNTPRSAIVEKIPVAELASGPPPTAALPPSPVATGSPMVGGGFPWLAFILATIGTLPAVLVAFFITCFAAYNRLPNPPGAAHMGPVDEAVRWGLAGALVVFILLVAFIGQYALPRRPRDRAGPAGR